MPRRPRSEGDPPRRPIERPHTDCYIVPGTRMVAGSYPGVHPDHPPEVLDDKLTAFLDAGITAFIDLTDPADGLEPYEARARELAEARDIDLQYDRLTIRDIDICTPAHMRKVLDLIDARLAEGHGVYLHCWGGIGRTGLTVGCWLVRQGLTGDRALSKVGNLFQSMDVSRVARWRATGSPQTNAQREMVRGWEAIERPSAPGGSAGGGAAHGGSAP